MADLRKFEHVLRLGKPELGDILEGTVCVFDKLDGTNASIFYNDGKVCAGSRNRAITPEDDNAGFGEWALNSEEALPLRNYVTKYPHLIVYGEWLGGIDGKKFVGKIKDYKQGGFFVFGVYDTEIEEFQPHYVYSDFLSDYDKVLQPIKVLYKPSVQDITDIMLNKAHFNLPAGKHSEGVVIWNYNFRNEYGEFQVGKLVNEEYQQKKAKKQRNSEVGECEPEIVAEYVTDADIEKAMQKACVKFGLDEWKLEGKTIGFVLSGVWHDLICEEMFEIVKKYRQPTIDFAKLKFLVEQKVKAFIGL